MKKLICIILSLLVLTVCFCSCKATDNKNDEILPPAETSTFDKTSTPSENTAAQEPKNETMAEKLIREIEAKYEEELDLPENSSTAGMCSVSSKYTEKWEAVADHCYNKIMNYNGIVAESEEFYSSDDLHTFVSNMKKSWELYYQEQCENYEKALATIYSKGSVVGPIFADYQYEMQKEWALQLVYICQHIGLDWEF